MSEAHAAYVLAGGTILVCLVLLPMAWEAAKDDWLRAQERRRRRKEGNR